MSKNGTPCLVYWDLDNDGWRMAVRRNEGTNMNIYNLILYIGLALMALGTNYVFVSCIMERYETKLHDKKRLRKDDKWRK